MDEKILIFLRALDHCTHEERALSLAAGRGNVEELRWLLDHKFPIHVEEAFMTAVEFNRPEVMKFLIEENLAELQYVVRSKDLELVKTAIKLGQELTPEALNIAIQWGNKEIVSFLREQKCPSDDETFFSAHHNKDLETLKWLNINRKENWLDQIYYLPDYYHDEDLELVKWLFKHSCKITIKNIFRHVHNSKIFSWCFGLKPQLYNIHNDKTLIIVISEEFLD